MNKIIIVAGDPNSINSEIIFKCWRSASLNIRKRITIIGNYELLKKQSELLKLKVPFNTIKNIDEKNKDALNIISFPIKFKNCFDVSIDESSKYVIKCLNYAHVLSQTKKIKGFINCPVDKKLIKKKGIYGVTELIAKKSNIKNDEVMLLYNKKLSVVPITTHIKLKSVPKKISKKLIKKKIKTIDKFYTAFFDKKPKIAILGMNPHNDELSKNSEEKKIIIPAIREFKNKKKIFGPFSADSFFINDYKKYDVVIGMYHDQVLIPFKSIFKFDAINITLGLKYLRMSPDHGTATGLIKKNKANYKSLFKCIKLFYDLYL